MYEQEGKASHGIAPLSGQKQEIAAVWDNWNVPSIVTDPDTGRPSPIKSHAVIELLFHRFYAQPCFNSIIVPNQGQMVKRLKYGNPTPIPTYLLHTIIACATASKLTIEGELQLWQSQVWHGATESVHARLNRTGPPELELVQALLLLSCNWSGSLLRIERINTFDTAVSLATSLQLHSSHHLDVSPGPRSNRITLFWALYCIDKVLSILTKRSPAILIESHSIPLPSMSEIRLCSASPPRSTVDAWLQRLTYAYITLAQITEELQVHILLPIQQQQSQATTLDQIFRKILPIEKKLEIFCKEQRWLLGAVSKLSPLCRNLAEAVVSQLHFTQLHLYLPALHLEVDQRRNNGSIQQQTIHFSPENDKPLAATIESAWHLAQQQRPVGEESVVSQSTLRDGAIYSPSSLLDPDSSLNFSHACVLIGMSFFKFLDTNWSGWDRGNGCLRYVPIHLSSPPFNDHHHQQQQQLQADLKNNERDETLEESLTFKSSIQRQRRNLSFSDKATAHFAHAPRSSLHNLSLKDQQNEEKGDRSTEKLCMSISSFTCFPDQPIRAKKNGNTSKVQNCKNSYNHQHDNDGGKTYNVKNSPSSSKKVSTPVRFLFQDQGDQILRGQEGSQ